MRLPLGSNVAAVLKRNDVETACDRQAPLVRALSACEAGVMVALSSLFTGGALKLEEEGEANKVQRRSR